MFIKKSWISKLSILLLISLLIFSFTACSNKGNETTEEPKQVTEENNTPEDNTAGDKEITLATTTSVNDSGLMDYLTPMFEKETGYTLDVVSQGTGQALQTGRDGNADVLLIHAKADEEKFVEEGYGLERVEIMYNYFVIVGPSDNPAKIGEGDTAADGFKKIADTKSTFVSRGDESGTHKKELKIWEANSIKPEGDWYMSAGKGMGDVLQMASEEGAYTITDKATYLSMKDKLELDIIVGESDDLMNQYTVIQANPDKLEGINKEGADAYLKWITSDEVLAKIGEFGKEEYGDALFSINYQGK